MVILGGTGRLGGAMMGALAVVLLQEFLSHWLDYWRLVFGPILVLLALFARGGLAGLLEGRSRA